MARPPVTDMLAASADDIGAHDSPTTARAVALMAMAHATRDQSTWGGLGYWDQLGSRALLATYRADTLAGWWEQMCRAMGCGQPTRSEDRHTLAASLAAGDDRTVLDVIACDTDALCLRVRLAWELHFGSRKADQADDINHDAHEGTLL